MPEIERNSPLPYDWIRGQPQCCVLLLNTSGKKSQLCKGDALKCPECFRNFEIHLRPQLFIPLADYILNGYFHFNQIKEKIFT